MELYRFSRAVRDYTYPSDIFTVGADDVVTYLGQGEGVLHIDLEERE
jgi:hypothetical protein